MAKNVALKSNGGSVNLQNVQGGSHSPEMLNDGSSVMTVLYPVSGSVIVTISLPQEELIDKVVLSLATNYAVYQSGYKILVSREVTVIDDGSFTMVADKTGGLFYGQQTDTFAPILARSVRIVFEKTLKPIQQYGVAIGEVEVFSSDQPFVECTVLSPLIGVAPLSVIVRSVFRNLGQNIPVFQVGDDPTVKWIDNFGITDREREHRWTYSTAGQYTPKYVVEGTSITGFLPQITVLSSIQPEIVSFTVDKDIVQSGQEVILTWQTTNTDKVTINGVDYPANGMVRSIPQDNLYHTQNTTAYLLIATNRLGLQVSKQIKVKTYVPIKANFISSTSRGKAPLTVDFIDTSQGTVVGREWTIDSKKFSDAKVSYTFMNPGQYGVSLKITGVVSTEIVPLRYIEVIDPFRELTDKIDLLTAQLVEARGQAAFAINDTNSLKAALDKAMSDDTADKQKISEAMANIDTLNSALADKISELLSVGQKYADSVDMINSLKTALGKALGDDEYYSKTVEELRLQLNNANQSSNNLLRKIEVLQADLNKANSGLSSDIGLINSLQSMLDSTKVDYQNTLAVATVLRTELLNVQQANDLNVQKINQLMAVNNQFQEQIVDQVAEIKILKAETERLAASKSVVEQQLRETRGTAPTITITADKKESALGSIWQWLLLAAGIGLVVSKANKKGGG